MDLNEQPAAGIKRSLLISAAITVLMAAVLFWLGRIWWCKSGDWAIYVHEAWNSSHTSQHFFDPYTFTHILHGVMFFWIAGLLFPRLPVATRFVISIAAEAGWEILENTNFIIEKYRANTASLDYYGDSIMNSVGDVAACAAGFWIAMRFGWWRSLIFFLLIEIGLLIWIRDSLVMNIIMLVWPSEGLKEWQMS